MPKIVIIAALERELAPLISGWHRTEVRTQNRTVRIYQKDDTLVAFGGIGGISARIAAEAAYQHADRNVSLFISAGLAGALVPELKTGQVFIPESIISDSDNNTIETASGMGTLVTVGAIAGAAHKKLFADKYHAQALDMEAFSVADVARIYNVDCIAMKAISDELDFDLPPLGRFVTDTGDFRTSAFVAYAAVRPWIWPTVMRLNKNSELAIKQLCAALEQTIARYARTKTTTGLIVNSKTV
jgi:adenosylhomocysteine nucleosidase